MCAVATDYRREESAAQARHQTTAAFVRLEHGQVQAARRERLAADQHVTVGRLQTVHRALFKFELRFRIKDISRQPNSLLPFHARVRAMTKVSSERNEQLERMRRRRRVFVVL